MRILGRDVGTTRAIAAIAALLALLGASIHYVRMDAVASEGASSGFRQSAEVDQRSYREGEPVVITYRACRVVPWPTTTTSGGGTDVLTSFRVLDADGDVIADTSHLVHTLELRTVPWLPGQCRSVDREWDQRYWNLEPPPNDHIFGTPVEGDRVPPGEYRVEVTWQGVPARTGTFTIEP